MSLPAKKWLLGIAGLLIVAIGATGLISRWRKSATSSVAALEVLAPEPGAVAPGIYLLGKTSPAAAYAVQTSDGLVLVDSGLEADARVIEQQLQTLHLDIRQLRAILLTHSHADHSQGAQQLRARSGAKVYAGQGDCQHLRDGSPPEAFFSVLLPDFGAHPTTVDVELAGEETLDFGDTKFKVIATPGHTPGSVCYLLERPALRALFTGDIVLHLGASGNDPQSARHTAMLGTYSTYLAPRYGGNAEDYLASLKRLRSLPTPDLILPGHPQIDLVPQDPHLSAERWQAILDQGIAEMEWLLVRYKTDGANFLDGVPKRLLPYLHYLGDLDHTAIYCIATPKELFVFGAPGRRTALVDFLAQRFRELGWTERKPAAVILTSADKEVTGGLPDLVRKTGCQVVAPEAGLKTIQELCPAGTVILTEKDLEKREWFEVRTISLRGRGVAPVAYQLRWAGKVVLFSGRIPVKPSLEATNELMQEFSANHETRGGYLKSLQELALVKPDLWLPAVPSNGQNANLYDRDWEQILGYNKSLAELYP
jgi:glyoxylase-like metal-dependent hydrolase (beta-lactamase superfamily II)